MIKAVRLGRKVPKKGKPATAEKEKTTKKRR